MSTGHFGVDQAYVAGHGTGRKVLSRTLIVLGAILVINLAILLLGRWLDPQTSGPFGSSYVTTQPGVGAWHDLLIALGRPSDRSRTSISDAQIEPGATIIVVDPEIVDFDRGYAAALLRHADGGGRVLLVGVRNLGPLFDLDLELSSAAEGVAHPTGAAPLTAGVDVVTVAAGTRYVGNSFETVIADETGAVVVRWPHGEGDVIAVSDPWMFTNGWMGQADNAVLAVRLTGAGPVVFDEYVHGFGAHAGPSGLGATVFTVIGVGVLAALVGMWAIGKRLGPAEQSARALPPSRGEYLNAMARSLDRSKDRAVFAVLRRRALHHVHRIGSRYVGLTPEEQQVKAAAQLGLTSEELAVLGSRTDSGSDVQMMASVAAKIERNVKGHTRWTSSEVD